MSKGKCSAISRGSTKSEAPSHTSRGASAPAWWWEPHPGALQSVAMGTPRGLPPHAPLCASPCPRSLVPTHGTVRVLHGRPFPLAYLLAGEAAWPRQHWGVSFLRPALPLYSPLLTNLRQPAALLFCLCSTGEASEETCKSSPRRLLLHLALSSGRGHTMNRSRKAKGAQRVLSSGFEQAAAHSWI